MKFCSKCGTQAADDAVFCAGCGNRFEAPQPVAAPVAPVEPVAEAPVESVAPVQQPYAEPTYAAQVAPVAPAYGDPAYAAPVVKEPASQKSNLWKILLWVLIPVILVAAAGGAYHFVLSGEENGEKFVGDWTITVDVETMFTVMGLEESYEGTLEAIKSGMDMEQTYTLYTWEFDEEGNCSAYLNKDSLNAFYENFIPALLKEEYRITAQTYGMTYDQIAQQVGYASMDEMIQEFVASEMAPYQKDKMTFIGGSYTLEEGDLMINGTRIKHEFDGNDTLTFTGVDSDRSGKKLEELYEKLNGLTLERTK